MSYLVLHKLFPYNSVLSLHKPYNLSFLEHKRMWIQGLCRQVLVYHLDSPEIYYAEYFCFVSSLLLCNIQQMINPHFSKLARHEPT